MSKTILHSQLIDRLEDDLRKEFPYLRIERTDSSIRIPSDMKNGFDVELVDAVHEVVPSLGCWVAYGLDQEEAIPLFQAGLRGDARVREISRASVAYHWKVDFLRNGVWVEEKNDYYSVPFPYLLLGRKQERVLWNDPSRLFKS